MAGLDFGSNASIEHPHRRRVEKVREQDSLVLYILTTAPVPEMTQAIMSGCREIQ